MNQKLTSSTQASSPKRAKLSGGGKSYYGNNSKPRRGGGGDECKGGKGVKSKGFGGGKGIGGLIGKQIKEGRKGLHQLNGNFEKSGANKGAKLGGHEELVKSAKKRKRGHAKTFEKETTEKRQKLNPLVQKKEEKGTIKTIETETTKKKQKFNSLVQEKEGNKTVKIVEEKNIKKKQKRKSRKQKKEKGAVKTVEKEAVEKKQKLNPLEQKKEGKESTEKAHVLEKLHPFIQGKHQEYLGYPGWSADEIHWLLEQFELVSSVRREGSLKSYCKYQEENKWKWVSSVLKKHSADKCKDLWVQIQKELKPVTFKTSLGYVKKLLVTTVTRKIFKKKLKRVSKKAARTYTFNAENGNPAEMHWGQIKDKLPTLTNRNRAEFLAKHWQSTLEDDEVYFHYFKQHTNVFGKVCKKECLLSHEEEIPLATIGEQK